MSWRETWEEITQTPGASWGYRALLSVGIAAGVLMTGMGSMFWDKIGPIPFRWIPDLRSFGLVAFGLSLGVGACFGGAARRRSALWGVVLVIIGFHLEEATVHWIGPYPGSITGARVGILGTAGSILALACVALMHVEVESFRFRRDVVKRGAQPSDAESARGALARLGSARVGAVAAFSFALGLLVLGAERVLGNGATGGAWALLAGAALLLVVALLLARLVPRRAG